MSQPTPKRLLEWLHTAITDLALIDQPPADVTQWDVRGTCAVNLECLTRAVKRGDQTPTKQEIISTLTVVLDELVNNTPKE